MSDLLTTVTIAKEVLKVKDVNNEPLLRRILASMSRFIENKCKRKFKKAPYIEFFDGMGSDKDEAHTIIFIRNPPVSAVGSLHDSLDRTYGSSDLIPSSDYTFYPNEGYIELDGSTFKKGVRNIRVSYSGGYASSEFSDVGEMADIRIAVLILTGREWKRQERQLYGTTTTRRIDNTETVSFGPMPPQVKEILDSYTLPNV